MHQAHLRTARFDLTAARFAPRVAALTVHLPRLLIVTQIKAQAFVNHAFFDFSIQYRECQFDAFEHIALHPVRAGEVNIFTSLRVEIKYTVVFQHTPDDGAHTDILRQSFHTRTQQTKTAHDQIDFHARLRSLVQRVDDLRLLQRIHFRDDARLASGARGLGFGTNTRHDIAVQGKRRLPQMRQRARGSIVNIVSNLVESPVVPYHDYTTAKSSLVGFSRNLASELGPVGIRVNCVAPGLVYPTQGSQGTKEAFRELLMAATPLRRLARPEDVAGPVLFLASELSGFMTGQVLLVDGGLVMR